MLVEGYVCVDIGQTLAAGRCVSQLHSEGGRKKRRNERKRDEGKEWDGWVMKHL